MSFNRLYISLLLLGVLLISSCQKTGRDPQTLTAAIPNATKVVLYEGMPHHFYEPKALEEERRTKAVLELGNFPFYREPLALTDVDAKQLSAILGTPATYQPFSGEKKCGGFHPDYAVEWHVGTARYQVLICFGCNEVKVFGPGLESRNDLDASVQKLSSLLKGYQKNRPPAKFEG